MAMPCSSAAAIDLVVADAAAGLDDRRDPGPGGGIEAVAEREERIAGADAADGAAGCPLGRDPRRVEPVLLARTDAERLAVLRVHDRVAAHRRAHLPREDEVVAIGRRQVQRAVTTRQSARSTLTESGSCTSSPPSIGRTSNGTGPGGVAVSTRTFLRSASVAERVRVESGGDRRPP